ncbi:uncharacterized protein LOC132043682 isoform X1 [Lycium ferocissimum]|uniref:uncharacterized protein LOC132043682 isoform X1 n=1 Tax=Lycium ferocissimum TaxID=112874 RepID=UPI00281672D6|nr:uncharacterized protein LOC132043682 isoform X1 [Lycium ferocissimum]
MLMITCFVRLKVIISLLLLLSVKRAPFGPNLLISLSCVKYISHELKSSRIKRNKIIILAQLFRTNNSSYSVMVYWRAAKVMNLKISRYYRG